LKKTSLFIFCLVIALSAITGQNIIVQKNNTWFYQILDIPDKPFHSTTKPIIIAVIDDGFRLTHKDLKPFIFSNPKEIPGNNMDDDNNGYIDDYNGWDVSDDDNNVIPLAGREDAYFHGTAIAGIITNIVKKVYGEHAEELCKILPVKCISDRANMPTMLDGYKGIEYAMGFNPDIICCAWSGGTPETHEKEIIEKALKKGIIVITAAGNMFSEKDEFPGKLPGVWDIAALDTLNRKLKASNYSMRVDFSLPGVNVKAPFPLADNSYINSDGTSASTALMSGCAAILKIAFPLETNETIEEALKNTAYPLDSINNRYCGKLGAGIPSVEKSLEYLSNKDHRFLYNTTSLTKGTLIFNPKLKKQIREIAPFGAYNGFFLHFPENTPNLKGNVKIFNNDTTWYSQPLAKLPQNLFINGSALKVELSAPSKTAKQLKIGFSPKTIDSTTLFCRDTKYFTHSEDEFTDGSGTQNYANFCDCRWIITVPQGKRIKLEFPEFDTQAKIDFVWLFDGEYAIPEDIIAKFSGPNIPPTVTSATNKVLVWFVTDGTGTGKGWKLKYTTVD
jgi:serine protease